MGASSSNNFNRDTCLTLVLLCFCRFNGNVKIYLLHTSLHSSHGRWFARNIILTIFSNCNCWVYNNPILAAMYSCLRNTITYFSDCFFDKFAEIHV